MRARWMVLIACVSQPGCAFIDGFAFEFAGDGGREDAGAMDGGRDDGGHDDGGRDDGGVDGGFDAGMAIHDAGMDGGYDAGPNDAGPHAPCDRRFVTCGLPPPDCTADQLPLVVGGCWGACVPVTACACSMDAECGEDYPCTALGCKLGHCDHLASPHDGLDCSPIGGPPSMCVGYECVEEGCVPACASMGLTCGPDGCGGSCGECDPTLSCVSGSCQSVCGDGRLGGTELCDDGNTLSGDGCAACSTEDGWVCAGSPSICNPICVSDADCLADGEPCNGSVCEIATGSCLPPVPFSFCTTASIPSGECAMARCVPVVCGDGNITSRERCDDGNMLSLDGCDAVCRPEPGYTCGGRPSTCTAVPNGPLAGEIVITEIMHNPNVLADNPGEFVELFNAAPVARDVSHCVLTDTEGSFRMPAGTVVEPGDRLTISFGAMPGFTPDLFWGTGALQLSNSGDDVRLVCAAGTIDEVPSGWPPMNGVSMSLSPALTDAVSNDSLSSWCFATSVYASGDRGTPDLPNDPCP